MANEVIELPARQDAPNLPVTREAMDKLRSQRTLLREFVSSQLRKEVDFGTVPGTDKDTLYKPGAEKLAQLFGLGVKVVLSDRIIERDGNFAMFTYRAEIYPLRSPDLIIATCEGSCNSQEKKYRERRIFKTVTMERADGSKYDKRVPDGIEQTPITDVLNTLIKMSQKRAYVGAVILATGASDFFNQDIDDPEDAKTLGIAPKQKTEAVKASVPNVTSAASQNQAQPSASDSKSDSVPHCDLCGTTMKISRNGDAYTCPNWKDKSRGDHSYVRI